MEKCECGKEFKTIRGLKCHSHRCDGTGTPRDKARAPFVCPLCQQIIKACRSRHLAFCDGKGKRVTREAPGFRSWNKGLTSETDDRVKRGGEAIAKYHKSLSPEERSKKASHRGSFSRGGYRIGGGRGKKGRYKGIWCDSSWELAWVIFQLDHKNDFSRNTQGFSYSFENKSLKFFPDFVLSNNTFVEIKGWVGDQFKAKLHHFPHQISVIGREEIKPFLEYAIKTYGSNFIELYEK